MTRDHYAYISEQFNLSQYGDENNPDMWRVDYEGIICSSSLSSYEAPYIRGWAIGKIDLDAIFVSIPTKELADEIIQHIKDTEIMFL